MSALEEEHIEWLRRSREQIGACSSVIMTTDGTVIDGKHRLEAYPGWPVETVSKSRKEALIERIHRNIHRRVSGKERKAQILELALYLEDEGVEPENMLSELQKYVPFHENYIRKLLPNRYKAEQQRTAGIKSGKARKSRSPRANAPKIATGDLSPPLKIYEPSGENPAENLDEAPSKAIQVSEASSHQIAAAQRKKAKGAVTCPYCRLDLKVVLCSQCWRDLDVKELLKEA